MSEFETRQAPAFGVQGLEVVEQFCVGQLLAALSKDFLAAMKVATGTMPSNAPSLRIHISGGLSTCFFLSLKERRL